ncbi:MAG: hypothetical protein H0T84_02400, partial [Tatlockia sp.]|nr:hypothetical protein [Tatlockia sp.]
CGHNDYTTNNSRDSQRYQNFVHAVYRKEGLAYIEEYANKGEVEFATAELTEGYLSAQVALQQAFNNTQDDDERARIRKEALRSFQNETKNSNYHDKKRLASLGSAMSLYFKPLNSDSSVITEEQLYVHLFSGHSFTVDDLIEMQIDRLEQNKSGGLFKLKADAKIEELRLLQEHINRAPADKTYEEVINNWKDEKCLYENELGMRRYTVRSTMINQHRNFFSDLFSPITKEKSDTEKFIDQLTRDFGHQSNSANKMDKFKLG